MRKQLMLLLALSVGSLTPGNVFAATSGGQGLEISPPLLNVSANPGQVVNVQIKVRNITGQALTVKGKTDDFGAKGEDGEPNLLLDETQSTRYSLKYWIPVVPTLTLQPQEAKVTTVAIRVPANAEPGGHYGVIRFTGSAASLEGSGVALTASIGTLVLMRVNGDAAEKLSLVDVVTTNNAGKRTSLFENGPVTLTERFKNEGNVHVQPTGTLVLKNTFGTKVGEIPVNSADMKSSILPDSIRKFNQTIDKAKFGRYTVSGAVSYGTGKSLELKDISFWVLPYRLILAVLLALIIVIALTVFGLRRYKASIIKQSRRK